MRIKARLVNWVTLPPFNNSFVTIPGKAGVLDFGGSASEKILTVRCNVFQKYKFSSLVAVLDNLAEWLNPDNKLKRLVFDDVPDRYFTARLNGAVDCERLVLSAGAFDLTFVCPDPFAYALADEAFIIVAEGENTVTRLVGNTYSTPIYFIKGVIPQGASYISIETNGEQMRIIGSLALGETLIIDSALVTAKVVDSSGETLRNGLSLLQDLNFPILKKGDNAINISATGAEFTELKILAMSRWG
jgi:predicted phage tail component-like protein